MTHLQQRARNLALKYPGVVYAPRFPFARHFDRVQLGHWK